MRQYEYYSSDLCNNFCEYVDHLRKYANSPAITWYDRKGNKFVKTYSDVYDDVTALRNGLAMRDLARDRIAIAGENSYNWIVSFLAIASGGGTAVCVDIDQSDETIAELIQLADSTVVLASESIMTVCEEKLSQCDKIKDMISLESQVSDGVSVLMEDGRKSVTDSRVYSEPGDVAAIMFTSGTTALAKAVMLSHENLLNNSAAALKMVDLGENCFSGLPFFHAYGLNCGVFCPLLSGSSITICGELRNMMRDLKLSQAKTVFAVPLIMEAIYRQAWNGLREKGKEEDVEKIIRLYCLGKKVGLSLFKEQRQKLHDLIFGDVKLVICGGAHLNPEISKKLEAIGVLTLQGYGITECSPLISVNRNEYHFAESVGTILPGYAIRLEDGEIVVKGANVMLGYYNNQEETELVIKDGWFHTGDLGRIGKDGQIYITGRIKNLIVLKNGKKISPELLEQRILEIPQVKETLVYGTPSGRDLDDVLLTASVYPDPEVTNGMGQMEILEVVQKAIDSINEMLPDYQQLKLVNLRDREFEKTSSKKTKRYSTENHQ